MYVAARGYQTTNSSPALDGSRRLPPPPRHPHVSPLARSARPPRISYSPTCHRPGRLGPAHTAITASWDRPRPNGRPNLRVRPRTGHYTWALQPSTPGAAPECPCQRPRRAGGPTAPAQRRLDADGIEVRLKLPPARWASRTHARRTSPRCGPGSQAVMTDAVGSGSTPHARAMFFVPRPPDGGRAIASSVFAPMSWPVGVCAPRQAKQHTCGTRLPRHPYVSGSRNRREETQRSDTRSRISGAVPKNSARAMPALSVRYLAVLSLRTRSEQYLTNHLRRRPVFS